MRKLTIVASASALVLGGMFLPSLAQPGRTVTRETTTDSADFVRAGNHVLNRSQIAYVARHGGQATVYFLGNAPALSLSDSGDDLVAQLVPGDVASDPNLPPMPTPHPRSPFDNSPSRRVLPSPGAPQFAPDQKVEATPSLDPGPPQTPSDAPAPSPTPTPDTPVIPLPRNEPKSE